MQLYKFVATEPQKAADAGDEYAKDKVARLQKSRGFQKA